MESNRTAAGTIRLRADAAEPRMAQRGSETEIVLADEAWLVLHEVRLRGVTAVENDVVVAHLTDAGLVVRAARGVRVTPEGREAHASWARLQPGSDDEAAVRRAYERFLPINRELIRVCNDWQVR